MTRKIRALLLATLAAAACYDGDRIDAGDTTSPAETVTTSSDTFGDPEGTSGSTADTSVDATTTTTTTTDPPACTPGFWDRATWDEACWQ